MFRQTRIQVEMWMLACLASIIASSTAVCFEEPTALWYGELDAGARVFRFVITQAPGGAASGKESATLTSLDEGNAKFILDDFVGDDSMLQFNLKATQASYVGTLEKAGQTAKGKWKQGGAVLDLEFNQIKTIPVDSPKETWSGILNAGLQKLDMQVRGYETKDGGMLYFVDSLSQKVGGFKATAEIDRDEFRMTVPALQATYSGRMNEAKQEIIGKWKQAVSLELTLKRVDHVAKMETIERNRPQLPKPPFPYESRDVVFTNEADGIELAGTLTLPTGGKAHPLAILVSGSGPQDRDETILGHKPFWVIADYLSRQGIAVLRYDDRGTGKSQGFFSFATTADFARDTESAVAYARSIPEIDPARIGLIGHSEGGLIAPMVAAKDTKIAWIVLLAGPGVNGEQILYSQGKLMIAAEGGSLELQDQQLELQKATFKMLKDRENKSSTEAKVKTIVDQLMEAKPVNSDEEKARLEHLVLANWNEMKKPWFRFFAQHEPGPVLEKVQCPVFAINGSLDMQVEPKLNLSTIEKHLMVGGNTRFKTREFPRLNHLFQTCKTGGVSEYESIEETFSPAVLRAILEWILSPSA